MTRRRKLLVAAACGVLLLGLLASAFILHGALRWVLVAVLVGCLTVTSLSVVMVRLSRRTQNRLSRLEKLVADNHKRASVWNFHLTRGLGLSAPPSRDASTTGPSTTAVATSGPSRRHPRAQYLVSAGILDREFYGAVTAESFESDLDAASHLLNEGARRGVSPSPFLDLGCLPTAVRAALADGDPRALLTYLRSAEVYEEPLGALFHPAFSGVDRTAARRHSGGVLGAYLAGGGLDSELSVTAGEANGGSNAGAVREALIRHACEVHARPLWQGETSTTEWDFEASDRWVDDLLSSTSKIDSLVSVVMPVRNRASVVGAAIRSVLDQTHLSWELIVIDDGSTDGTADEVAEFARADDRITLLAAKGSGVSSARNQGLDAATGEYLAFLDSDNEWRPRFLELSLRAMQRDGLGAVYAAAELHDDTHIRYRALEGGRQHLLVRNHVDLNVMVVRADVVATAGRFDESLRRWVDHDFILQIANSVEPRLLLFIGCLYDDGVSADRITVTESDHWQWAVLGKHWVDWEKTPVAAPVAGRISVVVPTVNDALMTVECVASVRREADDAGLDVEVIVVDNGSDLAVGQELIARLGVSDRMRFVHLPRNMNFAIGSNSGAAVATGEFIFFLNNDTILRPGCLKPLLAALDERAVVGAQPLLLYGNETIQTAGTVFNAPNELPNHFLVGHPPEDASGAAGLDFRAVSAAALMMRSATVRRLRGFDPIFVNGLEDVDLCLRAVADGGSVFRVVPDSRVTHLESMTPGRKDSQLENRRLLRERWLAGDGMNADAHHEAVGFRVAHLGTDGLSVPGPRPTVVRHGFPAGLRWGIKIGSVPGIKGDHWGDTHFASSLRRALVDEGQSAVIHRHGAYDTPATAFDDVSLVIRGTSRVPRSPGKINILWVISHPQDITLEELREFDIIFAASETWARRMSEESGVRIGTLLQATDPNIFWPSSDPRGNETLFVGGTHAGRERKVVGSAIRAGVDVAVYGMGWEGQLPEANWRGQYIPNAELGEYYRRAHRVLADHWDDMAEEGFIQNRIFDAVACGARTISDPVEGMATVFHGAVQTFTSDQELANLCGTGSSSKYPSEDRMREIANYVRTRHSFKARADSLILAASVEFSSRQRRQAAEDNID